MKKTLTLVGVAGLAATVMLTGCSNTKADSDASTSAKASGGSTPSSTAQAPATPSSSVSVPATVTGAKWCAEVYTTYVGASSPDAAAKQLTTAAQTAKDEGKTDAANNLTALAGFLSSNATMTSLSPEQLTNFQDLDTKVGESFKVDCGGKTLSEVVSAQNDASGAAEPVPSQ